MKHTCTHMHALTFKHANTYIHFPWYTESTWDLKRGSEIKKKWEKIEGDPRNVLQTRHCKLFALHSRLCCVHVYVNSLRMEAASFATTLHLLTAFEGHWELHLQAEHQMKNAESTREMKRWEDSSHSPEDNSGETFGTLNQWTLMKPVRILGESRDFDNTISPPLAAAKASCFLLWMFGSNQPLPNTLSLQLHTCFSLPQAATCQSLLPRLPFFPWSRIPLRTFCFLPHSFNFFLRVIPTLLYPQAVYPPILAPCSGSTLRIACSEHCGMLWTAWSNVDEAQGSSEGAQSSKLLSDVSQSAQRFCAFD